MPASDDRSALPQTADGSSSEPLGLKHPLLPAPALGQRVLMPQFTAPLGARSLMSVLPAVPEYAPAVSFADSPFFAVSRSSLPIQPKRSSVAPRLMEPLSVGQPIGEEGSRDRRLSERPTLQRFSEPMPSPMPSLAGDETPTVPVTSSKFNTISDGTAEATNFPEASPVTEAMGMDHPRMDRPEIDRTRSEPLPTEIEPPSIANLPSQQDSPAAEFSANQGVDQGRDNSALPSPSLQRSLEITAPTREPSPESASPPISADSLSSLPSHSPPPSRADIGETAPLHTPVIQPRLEETPTEVGPMHPSGESESSHLAASPQVTPSSAPEIARKVLPQPESHPVSTAVPLPAPVPPEALPPNNQPRLDSPPLTPNPNHPQANQERVTDETALFSAIPAQETPEQSASPLQRQVDSLPIENSEGAVLPVNHAIAPASDGLPAFTDSSLPESSSPFKQTPVESTSKDHPWTQVSPEAVNSPESMSAALPSEQVADASVDSITRSVPPKGMVPETPISPVVQRSPAEQATNPQAQDLISSDSPSNAIPRQAESTKETTTAKIPSPATEATIAPVSVVSANVANVPGIPPHPISPTVEPSPTVAPTTAPTVESPPLEHSPIPFSAVSPQDSDSPPGSDSEGSTLQRKHAEFDQSAVPNQVEPASGQIKPFQQGTLSSVTDAAVTFTGVEPISEPIPPIANPPDESRSAPITPPGSDLEAGTSPTLQAFPSPAPIAPQDTLAAVSPSLPQPSIQRQTAPDMAVLPSKLPEQQMGDRASLPTPIQSTLSVTHGSPATQTDRPFAVANPDALGVASPPVIQASTTDATPSDSTVIQAHPGSKTFPPLPKVLQNLTILNPLGQANPLVQASRLTAPPSPADKTFPATLPLKAMQPVTESAPHTALNESLTQGMERQTEARVQVPTIALQKGERFSSPATTPPSQMADVPIAHAPDTWSSIDELLGRSPTSPVIQRFVDVPQADPFLNLNQQDAHRFDQPQGYHPLSALPLSESSPMGSPPMDSPNGEASLPSSTSEFPARTEAMEPASETQAGAHANPTANAKDEADKLDELAREIYQLLRQRFEIERERHGTYYPDRF